MSTTDDVRGALPKPLSSLDRGPGWANLPPGFFNPWEFFPKRLFGRAFSSSVAQPFGFSEVVGSTLAHNPSLSWASTTRLIGFENPKWQLPWFEKLSRIN